MFKPHFCNFIVSQGGFDEHRNPISISESVSEKLNCFLDQNLPNNPIFTSNGQLVEDASGIIYLDKDILSKLSVSIFPGCKVEVFSNKNVLIFSGTIKAFSEDLFHTRIWV